MATLVAYEALAPLVGRLRADTALHALLFADDSTLGPEDHRIWAADVTIPDSVANAVAIRDVMPRVLVESRGVPWASEQSAGDYVASLVVVVHVFVESGERATGEAIRERVVTLFVSTPLNSATIMGSGMVLTATPPPVRETEWRDAWRFTMEFTAGIVALI